MKDVKSVKVYFATNTCVLLVIVGCQSDGSAENMISTHSLYARVGRYETIKQVCDLFVVRLAAREDIGLDYAASKKQGALSYADKDHLSLSLINYLCVAAGGDELYGGMPLRLVHEGMQISHEQIDKFIELFRATAIECGIPERETDEFVEILKTAGRTILRKSRASGISSNEKAPGR